MYNWEEVRDAVNSFISRLEFEREPRELYAPIRYTLEQSGKRVRPVLLLMAYNIYKDKIEDALYPATAIETYHNYTLIHDSHHNCEKYVEGRIKAGMFNLGYLPGGDKNITTMRETTMPAIEAAIAMLDRDAILCIAIYPGHEEGDLEGKMVTEYLSGLDRFTYSIAQIKIINSPTSPYFMIVETK